MHQREHPSPSFLNFAERVLALDRPPSWEARQTRSVQEAPESLSRHLNQTIKCQVSACSSQLVGITIASHVAMWHAPALATHSQCDRSANLATQMHIPRCNGVWLKLFVRVSTLSLKRAYSNSVFLMARWADLEIVDKDFPLAVRILPGWPSEKRAEGSDSPDLQEQENHILLVRSVIVMEVCSIMKSF